VCDESDAGIEQKNLKPSSCILPAGAGVPMFAAAAHIAKDSDAVATLPSTLAATMVTDLDLRLGDAATRPAAYGYFTVLA
jgi:hypothetical protein